MGKQSVIVEVQEKLFMCLDQAWEEFCSGNKNEFLLGKIYAYVECLEIMFKIEGCSDDLMLAMEEKYGIR